MNKDRPWFAFYDEGVPRSIDYPPVPIDRLLAQSAARAPDCAAIIFGGRVGRRVIDRPISFRQLDEAVTRFAAALQRLGVRRGDRVAIYMVNCPQFVIAFYGALRAGAVAVPCNPLYVAEELEHQVQDAGAQVVVALSAFYPTVNRIREAAGVRHVIVANVKEYFPPLLHLLFTLAKERKGGHRVALASPDDRWFQELLAEKGELQRVDVSTHDTACLLYTGGTTGVPKGAQLTHRNLIHNALAGNALAQARPREDVTIGALPLFHSYGMTSAMNMPIAGPTTTVLIPDPRDILHVMGAIARHKAAFYPGVPTMYVAINNHPRVHEFDLSSIRCCLSAAAPLPLEVQQRFQEITGGRLVEAYGLTESSPGTHVNPPYGRDKPGTVGLPWPDTDARIVDAETGEQEMAVGETGELIVRGPQIMKGYWGRPTETANVLRVHPWTGSDEPWLHTGDIARMDEDGYFQIVDRKKDMIICGGFNVYPREVEEVLFRHPAVREAAVAGVRDAYRGETVKAYVVLREGATASADDIIAFCREHLARYKVPSAVEFRADLPKSAVGKVLRRELVKAESGS
jgi:long-chain acyl-CoA synthetase